MGNNTLYAGLSENHNELILIEANQIRVAVIEGSAEFRARLEWFLSEVPGVVLSGAAGIPLGTAPNTIPIGLNPAQGVTLDPHVTGVSIHIYGSASHGTETKMSIWKTRQRM